MQERDVQINSLHAVYLVNAENGQYLQKAMTYAADLYSLPKTLQIVCQAGRRFTNMGRHLLVAKITAISIYCGRRVCHRAGDRNRVTRGGRAGRETILIRGAGSAPRFDS
jgi:hypothetical protein